MLSDPKALICSDNYVEMMFIESSKKLHKAGLP